MVEPLTVLSVVGARPNFMKIAPIVRALAGHRRLRSMLVHTGQHYGEGMSDTFFDELQIPQPEVNLGIGSGSHAVQTAQVMMGFEPVLDRLAPACVLVVGDVNSTIACALVAVKKHIPVVHVEAGLRSFDRSMPEEINRVLTDQISERLYTTSPEAEANLVREGVDRARICFVGNVMVDTLRHNLDRALPPARVVSADIERRFGLLTLHRPSNVDRRETLAPLLQALWHMAAELPLVFPVHPRTLANIDSFGLSSLLDGRRIVALPPVSYLQMLGLLRASTVVLTDSGGLQEESTALGIPCLTLRTSTERLITVDEGTNTIVGTDPSRIRAAFDQVRTGGGKQGRIPRLWDGRAGERIVVDLDAWLANRWNTNAAAG